ncbi:hypothetical protein BpHYR1_013214 [Brachionus plicatilis]|uniref:Uncharacterized protein n=1 Tax=Brachionus plicatilis TaxID=10195 RepID=A0A3M7QKM6_BRAPC|nr:hypothetical protein BpHYR1_013214 [Brachionus plicatilis]
MVEPCTESPLAPLDSPLEGREMPKRFTDDMVSNSKKDRLIFSLRKRERERERYKKLLIMALIVTRKLE